MISVWNWVKFKKFDDVFLTLYEKRYFSTSETDENIMLFYLSFACIYVQYFFDVMRNKTSKISTRVNQKKIKS